MLFQMLTDKLPFTGGSAVEVMRRITQEEPEISSKGRLTLRKERNPGEVKPENVSAGQLWQVQPDLATLILRCLEKQTGRRLPSAGFLADELDRFLSGKPIQSRSVGTFERVWKLTQRNKVAALAILATSLSLIVGTVVSVDQAVRAREAERVALKQKKESDEIASIILESVHGMDEHLVGHGVSPEQMRVELLQRVSAFHGDPRRKAAMLEELSTVLNKPADLQIYREVLAEVEPQLDANDPLLWSMRYRVALKQMHMTDATSTPGLESRDELRRILAWQEAHLAGEDGQIYKTKYALAEELVQEVRSREALQEAEALLLSCITNYKKKADDFDLILGRIELMTAMAGLGRTEESLNLGRQTCDYAMQKFGAKHSITGRAYGRLAKHCREAGLVSESIECGRRAMDIYWHTVGPDYAKARASLKALSQTLVKAGDLAGNLELQRKEVKVCDQQLGPGHEYTLLRVEGLVNTLRQMNLSEEAQELGSSWLERVRLIEGLLPPEAAGLLIQQSITLLKQGSAKEAGTLLKELPGLMEKMTGDLPACARFGALADALLEGGREQESRMVLRQLISTFEQRQDENPQLAAQVLLKAKQQLLLAEKREPSARSAEN
jgi:hypothetical protein